MPDTTRDSASILADAIRQLAEYGATPKEYKPSAFVKEERAVVKLDKHIGMGTLTAWVVQLVAAIGMFTQLRADVQTNTHTLSAVKVQVEGVIQNQAQIGILAERIGGAIRNLDKLEESITRSERRREREGRTQR